MIILEDTRQQAKKHEQKHKYFAENGIKVERCRLYVGDYTLPDNQSVCIDTKKDLQELISDVTQQHERFRAELVRAKEAKIQLVILIEHGPDVQNLEDVYFWQNPRKHKVIWRTVNGRRIKTVISAKAVDGQQLYKSLCTMRDRYGVQFEFCTKDQTGAKIVEILSSDEGRY